MKRTIGRALAHYMLLGLVALCLGIWLTVAWSFWGVYLPYLKIKQRLSKRSKHAEYQILRIYKSDVHISNAVSVPHAHGTTVQSPKDA